MGIVPQSRSAWLVGMCVAGGVILSGCDSGNTVSTPSDVQPVPTTTSTNVVQEGFDIPSSPRYRLNVAGSGSFRPGIPVTLTVDVESVRGTGATDLELYLPELTAFEASRGPWRGIPRDTRMTPAQNRQISVNPGSRAGQPFTVVFPEPGLYTVQVIARQRTPDAVRDWTPQSTTSHAWVLVLEDGGRFSPVYDTTMILRDAISTGPFRHVDPQRQGPPISGVTAFRGGENQFCEVDCPPRNCCFGGSLTYWDPVPNQILPLGGVTVQLTFNTGELYETLASIGGYGGLPCPNPGETGFLSFVTISSAFTVRDHGSAGTTFANVSSAVCGTTLMAHNTFLRGPLVFAHMNIARNNGGNLFGKVRGPLPVDIETPVPADASSFYSPSQDRIHVMETQVFEQFGGFVAAHEYGHALQATAFAHGAPGMGTCNNPHFIQAPNTAGCAVSEGWADYFSISVLPTSEPDRTVAQFELNSWVVNFPSQGHLIEGAVAAYYLDMSDPANAAETDALSLGTRFVADIISSCEDSFGHGPSTLLKLRKCFENDLSPTGVQLVPGVTFPSGWSLGAMQQNFTWNIDGIR